MSPDHIAAALAEVRHLADERSEESFVDLLQELLGLGFGRYEVALAAGLSPRSTQRKYLEMGRPVSSEDRRRIAELAGFCQMASKQYLIECVAGWLNTPLHLDAPITGVDLLAKRRHNW